jgi:hypothetical protein
MNDGVIVDASVTLAWLFAYRLTAIPFKFI